MHEGHRKRLRNRFINEGLQNFEPHNILELLLFYCIPQRDTNEIAHRLIDQFGSFSEVLDASVVELMKVNGISEYSAVFLSMIPEICNKYLQDKALSDKICGLDKIAEFAEKCFIGMTTEHFLLICVDNRTTLISHHFISEGDVDSSTVDTCKMIQILSGANATAAVIAHNHPRGGTKPSRADLMTTIQISRALNSIHIRLLDHVIVCSDGYMSMAANPKQYGIYLNPD